MRKFRISGIHARTECKHRSACNTRGRWGHWERARAVPLQAAAVRSGPHDTEHDAVKLQTRYKTVEHRCRSLILGGEIERGNPSCRTQPSPSLSLISNGASAWFSVPDKISTGAPLPVVSRGRCSSGASVPGGVRRSCGAVAGSWWRGGSEPRVGRPEAKPRPRHCKGSYREHLREQHGTLPRHGEARTAWHGIVSSRAGGIQSPSQEHPGHPCRPAWAGGRARDGGRARCPACARGGRTATSTSQSPCCRPGRWGLAFYSSSSSSSSSPACSHGCVAVSWWGC